MKLQLGYSDFCWPHTVRKQMQTKCIHDLRTSCGVSHLCLSSRSERSTYALDELQLFWSWENLKMVQVVGSLVYTCGSTSWVNMLHMSSFNLQMELVLLKFSLSAQSLLLWPEIKQENILLPWKLSLIWQHILKSLTHAKHPGRNILLC